MILVLILSIGTLLLTMIVARLLCAQVIWRVTAPDAPCDLAIYKLVVADSEVRGRGRSSTTLMAVVVEEHLSPALTFTRDIPRLDLSSCICYFYESSIINNDFVCCTLLLYISLFYYYLNYTTIQFIEVNHLSTKYMMQ